MASHPDRVSDLALRRAASSLSKVSRFESAASWTRFFSSAAASTDLGVRGNHQKKGWKKRVFLSLESTRAFWAFWFHHRIELSDFSRRRANGARHTPPTKAGVPEVPEVNFRRPLSSAMLVHGERGCSNFALFRVRPHATGKRLGGLGADLHRDTHNKKGYSRGGNIEVCQRAGGESEGGSCLAAQGVEHCSVSQIHPRPRGLARRREFRQGRRPREPRFMARPAREFP